MGSNGGNFSAGVPVILTFFALTVFFTILSASVQYYRSSRTKQELVSVLNEFNGKDNEVGLNWVMKIEVFYQETRHSNGRRGTYKRETVCAELEYIQVATGPMFSPPTNQIPLTAGSYGVAFSSLAYPTSPPPYEAPDLQVPRSVL
ncbi:hypothetical protein HK104_008417 [Borealophlyctis nickersoniae]|nr:hypothetical protein HK104_008417 [Borealophlyctis nickersoniae]